MLKKTNKNPQLNVFQIPLKSFINLAHEMVLLSDQVDWDQLERELSVYYSSKGSPAVPVRKIAGLLLLKRIFNESDESVIERWKENPYWQYFCGEVYFQYDQPFDPSDFVHFRKRVGKDGVESILKISIDLHGKDAKEKEVTIDTTIQEKNITYPTDTKLQFRIIKACRKIARAENIKSRQSYVREVKQLMIDQRFRNHPKRKKKARAAARRIKTIAGRLVRELERKLPEGAYSEKLELYNLVLAQKKSDKNKIYSLHEPNVKCFNKGKEAKKFEYGNKSSIVLTKTNSIVVGAIGFTNNIYDGHTLVEQLEQVAYLTGKQPKVGIVDRGYKGKKEVNGTQIVSPKPLPVWASNYQKQKMRKRFRRRAGIEPVISHLKYDHRMLRNFLKGDIGDEINTILAGAAFNFKKKLNQIRRQNKILRQIILERIFVLLVRVFQITDLSLS